MAGNGVDNIMDHRLRAMLEHAKQVAIDNPSRARNIRELSKHNLSRAGYNKLYKAQCGLCAICGERCSSFKELAVDHCHTTGKVRGLLCMQCNTALGQLKDDVNRLQRAITYLNGDTDQTWINGLLLS